MSITAQSPQIYYGTSSDSLSLGGRSSCSFRCGGMDTKWTHFIENLNSNTTYYYKISIASSFHEDIRVETDVLSFTTTGVPQISSIEPTSGSIGTQVTFTGSNFGDDPEIYPYTDYKVGFGCNINQTSPTCLADIISWTDNEVVVVVTSGAISGITYLKKDLLFTINGPEFTVVSGGQPTTNENVNTGQPVINYVTNAYGCDFSTSKSDANTIKVSTLFIKGSDTDKYLNQVYNAYKEHWNRYPKCSEMQFHLDHSTPIDRLTSWLKNEAITEKYGCKISTTVASDDTIRVKTTLTFNNDTDQYLNKVYNAYYDEWSRYPRCTEIQFHLDHSTPIDRLTNWLKENAATTTNVNAEVTEVATEKIEFKDTGTEIELKDKKQTLKFEQDKQITFTGTTIPNAFVVLTINSEEPTIATTISDSGGEWVYTMPGPLEVGDHTVKVSVSDKDGKKVSESDPITFSIITTAQAAQVTTTTEEETDNTLIWMIVIVIAAFVILLIIYFATRKKPQTPQQK